MAVYPCSPKTVAVLGAGSWGTALALLIADNGHTVRLWAHRADHVEAMQRERRNTRYFSTAEFPANLEPLGDLPTATQGADYVVVSVPSRAFPAVIETLQLSLEVDTGIVWATKGFDEATGELLHTVVERTFGAIAPRAVISGPSFAGEVVKRLPTALTVASPTAGFAEQTANLLRNHYLRAYTSSDLIGVQLGGAIKNILAIAAGVADGLGFGANTRAALITRGLAEMMRLGVRLGGRPETLMGLAGLGDLVLTCTDDQSRNRRFGLALGRGDSVEDALLKIGQEVEGARAAVVVHRLLNHGEFEMPICEQVYRVLKEGLAPQEAVHNLLTREPKPERMG